MRLPSSIDKNESEKQLAIMEAVKKAEDEKRDLEKDIQDKLDVLDDSNVMTEEEIEEEWQQAMQNAGLNLNNG